MGERASFGWMGAVAAVAVVSLAVVAGLAAARLGAVPAIALAMAVPIGIGLLLDARVGLLLTTVLIAILPYGTLPVRVLVTPSLVSLAAAATVLVWAIGIFLRPDSVVRRTAVDVPLLLVLAASLFSFVTGMDRGYTSQTFHDYAKLVIGIVITVVAINTMRARSASILVGILVGATTVAASIGLILNAGGRALTEDALTRLLPLGYPAMRIVRWIEDDPLKPMRLTSTGVDPNSFGGLLMIALVLAVGLALADVRSVPRWLTLPAIPVIGAALLLTYSRGAWVGVGAGLVWLAVVRYRRLAPILVVGGLVALSIGAGSGFIGRLIEGILLQDPATRLRLAEYQNALAIIQAYPVFGVGFGQAPQIDLQTGVSSIYLAVASRMGLVGLAMLVWAIGAILLTGWRGARRHWESQEGELLVTLLAALVSALTAGALDHYFFNIEFSHMGTLFWLLAGTVVGVATAVGDQQNDANVRPHATATLATH